MLWKFQVWKKLLGRSGFKPKASEVLTCHLKGANYPHWTSYFVSYRSVQNDQFGLSHFNWDVEGRNYHILRTGCYPFMKYHCTRRPYEDLSSENKFYQVLKVINLGIPTFMYGICAIFWARHHEDIVTNKGTVRLYFWYPEDRNSPN